MADPLQSLNSEITTFTFEDGQKVRLARIDTNGVPWFVYQDLQSILDLKSRSSLAALDSDERGVHRMDTPGGFQPLIIVSESGLYRLVFKSRKENAKRFTRWVTREVLPSIRRTGAYARSGALPSGDPAIRELLEAQRQILAVEQERLDLERARLALARFPELDDLERGAVRSKLTDMINTVATIRGRCTSRVWQELYLTFRARNGIDLYAQTASARRQGDHVNTIIQYIDRSGLIDPVYKAARLHFLDEITAKPVEKRVPQLLVMEHQLPTAEERIAEMTFDFAMGRIGEPDGDPPATN